jgi:hypothetical protein
MIPGRFYIIFSVLVILLAGCRKGNHSPPIEAVSSEKTDKQIHFPAIRDHNYSDFFRFQHGLHDIPTKNNESQTEENNIYEYRRPEVSSVKIPGLYTKEILAIERRLTGNHLLVKKSARHLDQEFSSISPILQEVIFVAVFDNDIFDYTDYYYTNGIILELYHPAIAASPIARILPGFKNSANLYSINLVQNLYTPLKLEDQEARVGDRPFASYLAVGHQRISLLHEGHRRMQNEFVLGVIGPASLGRISQDLIHTHEPVGWINQVSNDFILNYNFRVDQGVFSSNAFDAALIAGGQAGTLYDNIMAGAYFQFGKANDRYSSVFQTTSNQKPYKKRVRYYFALELKNKLMLYDATLQGGMFNKESVYTLNERQVKRYVFTGTAYFGIGLGRYSLEAEQVFLTPEFNGGRRHLWFRIKNVVRLN